MRTREGGFLSSSAAHFAARRKRHAASGERQPPWSRRQLEPAMLTLEPPSVGKGVHAIAVHGAKCPAPPLLPIAASGKSGGYFSDAFCRDFAASRRSLAAGRSNEPTASPCLRTKFSASR